MARRKTKPAQATAEKQNGAEKPADAPRLRTEAELAAAEQDARARKAAALKALAANDKHPTAVRDLHAANNDLRVISDERADRREIHRLQTDERTAQAELARQAAARKAGAVVVADVRENGKDADELVMHFNAVAECAVRITERTQRLLPAIHGLPGDDRTRGMAARTAANVGLSIGRLLRPALTKLSRTPYLHTWITVNRIPSEPNVNPSCRDESHAEARARVEALPKTAAEIYEQAAREVEGFINTLLSPPEPEPVDPADITPWHGSTKPNGGGMTSAEANVSMGFDDSAQKARRARRVADSARPITRDSEGRIVGAEPETFSEGVRALDDAHGRVAS